MQSILNEPLQGSRQQLDGNMERFRNTFWQVAKTEALKAGLGNIAANGTLYVGEKAHFPVPVTMLLTMAAGFAVHRTISAGGQKVLQMVNGEGEVLAEKAVTTDAVQEAAPKAGETSYAKSILNKLKNTENFTDSSIEHIFEGQVNGRDKAVGYHYDGIEGTVGKIISGTDLPSNEFGVYKAQVEVNGIPKTAK